MLAEAMPAVTREQLHHLIWSKPIAHVAVELGISDSYLVRVCRMLRIPRPKPGHWVKLKAGKEVVASALPPAERGQALEWSKGNGTNAIHVPPVVGRSLQGKRRNQTKVTGTHRLIDGSRIHFESGRPVPDKTYLKPLKRLLVDITVSQAALVLGLEIANALFNALESAGHRVVISHPAESFRRMEIDEREVPRAPSPHRYPSLWCPCRPTVVYIGNVAVGLSLVEMSESILMRYVNGRYVPDSTYDPAKGARHFVDHTWTTTQDIPTSRFRLIAYAPNRNVAWSTSWQESKKDTLTGQIPRIIKAMEQEANELAVRIVEADAKAERERQAWMAEAARRDREEDVKRIEASIKESQEHLEQIIQAWTRTIAIEKFLAGIQMASNELGQDRQERLLARLALARELLGYRDPLEFFLAWKTPTERYAPRFNAEPAPTKESADH